MNLVILELSDIPRNHRTILNADLVIQVDTIKQEFIIIKNRYGKKCDDFIPVSLLPKVLENPSGTLIKVPDWR